MAHLKIASLTLMVNLDRNWSSFQLAKSTSPPSVTDSANAPSARMPWVHRTHSNNCENHDVCGKICRHERRRQTYQLGGVHVGRPVHQVLYTMYNQLLSRTASTVFQSSPAAPAIFNLGNTNLASTRASRMMLVNFGLVHLSHRCVTHTGAEYGSDTDASK